MWRWADREPTRNQRGHIAVTLIKFHDVGWLAVERDDPAAVERFWPAAHEEVRVIARAHLAREGPDCSLQTTELVAELYIRLGGNRPFR